MTPTEGNQALPGRRRPGHLGAQEHAPAALRRAAAHHHDRDHHVALAAASTTRCRRASASATWHGLEFLASYTFAKGTTNNRGFYGVFGGTGPQGVTSATEGAYWQNTYDPEAEWGPTFHDVRHNFIFSASYELPFGKGRKYGSDWSGVTNAHPRRLEARRHLPGAHRPARSRSSTAATARCRASAAPSGRTASAIRCRRDQSITHWLDINAFAAGAARDLRQLPDRRRAGAGLLERRPRALEALRDGRAAATSSSGSRPSTLFNHPSFGPPARDISVPEHVRRDHEHDQLAARDRAGVEVLLLTKS